VNHGSSATITINPDAGYHIAGIIDNGPVTIANPYVISNVTVVHTVVVTFAINTYTVNASVTGGHGSVDPATQSVDYGDSASIGISPDGGYRVASITDNGQAVTIDDPYMTSYEISSVMEDHTVVVTFSIEYELEISVSPDGGGSVTEPGEGTFPYGNGDVVDVVAEADEDYIFVGWTGTAVEAGKVADPLAPTITITIDGAYTLEAHFFLADQTWNCPLSGVALIAPYPNNGRPFLTTAVALQAVLLHTAEWLQVLWLDEETGDWKTYFSGFSDQTNTLLDLQPDEFYYVIVSDPAILGVPQAETP